MNRFGWVALLLHLHLPNSFYLHHIKKKIKAKSNFQGKKIGIIIPLWQIKKRIYVLIWDFWRNSGRFLIPWHFQCWIPQVCTDCAEFPSIPFFKSQGTESWGQICAFISFFYFHWAASKTWRPQCGIHFSSFTWSGEDALTGRGLEWAL